LTAHLIAAFLIYAYMFWVALSLLFPSDGNDRHPWYGKTVALTILITITVISGGFVAGLKAGKVFNTFPKMGEYWVPPGLMAIDPWWKNFFDNIATVQFDHRILAITTFALIVTYWFRFPKSDVPARIKKGVNALLHTAVLQVALGITTLLLVVPIPLAAAHQGVAMLLFTVALYLCHGMRRA
jgi:cytochrome c oxidase assembly protein subunit 15